MRDIKYAENICDLHSFPVYKIFFFPARKHDMMLLFLNKPDSRLMRVKHACASNMHCARVGKHLLSKVRVYSN